MNRYVFPAAFAVGLLAVGWVGAGFVVGASWLALAMTAAIAGVYLLGAFELRRFRAATASLAAALAQVPPPAAGLGDWLARLPASLRHAVRLRIEGERVALPGPALTPYLVGLLVMLGMLGTFLGMVVTFQGAVFALEGSTDLQAIRSALAAPIKGLGLAFGTSVAGVAASAMLGLLSALSRRERLEVARQLDARIADVLHPFTGAHQRQENLRAMQVQAQALPLLVDRLQALMEGLEQRSRQLDGQLLAQQAQFHREAAAAYSGLAGAVGGALQDSLAAGARAAGESLRPVVETAMAQVGQESQRLHRSVFDATQAQMAELLAGFGQRTAELLKGSGQRATELQAGFEQRSAELLAGFGQGSAELLAGVEQRTGELLAGSGQRTGELLTGFEQRSAELLAGFERSTGELLARSEALVGPRVEAEARWTEQQGERMEQLAALWRSELGLLRAQEAAHGEAAVARLGELQQALAGQLATLGGALEAPLARLLDSTAEVPQAAAEVLAQLRRETTQLAERDTQALQERAALVQRIDGLLLALDEAGARFSQTLEAQAGRAAEVATHTVASAVELASLGESFDHGVQLFSASNEKLVAGLQGVEAALKQSQARSDEQLAYYVAQAREVIDLSITAQQGLLQDLRRRETPPAAPAAPVPPAAPAPETAA